MEKVLDFLEKHCQWLAIGLGGLFLAWTLSSYVLFAPVSVQANGKTFMPGDVDDSVKVASTDPLEKLLKDNTVVPPPVHSTIDPAVTWSGEMTGKVPVVALGQGWAGSQADQFKVDDKEGPKQVAVKVTGLPTLPPSETVEVKAARALVTDAPPAPGTPGAAAPVQPAVQRTAQADAGQMPAQAAVGRDISYVRLSYNLDAQKIAAAFTAAKIPPAATGTSLVHVRLMRQEQDGSGTWGPATEVPSIKNNVVQEPVPGANPPATTVTAFRTWAEGTGLTDMLRPPFYPVTSGEGPWDPSADDQLPKYDPNAERQKRDDEAKARKEAEIAKRAAKTPAAPRATPAPRPSRGARGVAVDPQRPAAVGDVARLPSGQARPPAEAGGAPAGVVPGPGGDPNAAAVPAVPGTPPTDPLPPGNFQPAALAANVLGWVYDDTVVEGHTYRYQVLYSLRNPVYNSNIVADPALAQQFAIESKIDDAAWSPPVEVKPTAEFYLASTNWTESRIPGSIKVNVFKWAQGKWQMTPFTVAPGDPIGSAESGIDYGTKATLVDIRYDTRAGQNGRAYVLLLTADGRLIERDPTVDLKNDRMLRLRQAVQQGATPAAGTTPQANAG